MQSSLDDLPADAQIELLRIDVDSLARLALSNRSTWCVQAANALAGAIRWKNIYRRDDDRKAVERAVVSAASSLRPADLAQLLVSLRTAKRREEERYATHDLSDDEFMDTLETRAVAATIYRSEWTPSQILSLSELRNAEGDVLSWRDAAREYDRVSDYDEESTPPLTTWSELSDSRAFVAEIRKHRAYDPADGWAGLHKYMKELLTRDPAKRLLLQQNWSKFDTWIQHSGHFDSIRMPRRPRRRPMDVELRYEALEELALQTFRVLGYDGMDNYHWPSERADGPDGLRRSLSVPQFLPLAKAVIHSRVADLTAAEAAWFVLRPFIDPNGTSVFKYSSSDPMEFAQPARSTLTDLELPAVIMIAVFERFAVEERRGDRFGTQAGAHRCFHGTAALVLDWAERARPHLAEADQQLLAEWFRPECKHWLQDCLTARFLDPSCPGATDWDNEEHWDDVTPSCDYFTAEVLPFGIENMGDRHNLANPCGEPGTMAHSEHRGCPCCDGSLPSQDAAARLLQRRWVRHEPEATSWPQYVAAVEELRGLAEALALKLPGVDAQTQTDFDEGADAAYEPWHCWSYYHQEGQEEIDREWSALRRQLYNYP